MARFNAPWGNVAGRAQGARPRATLLDWAETAHESLKSRRQQGNSTLVVQSRWSQTHPSSPCSRQRLFVTVPRTTFRVDRHCFRRRARTRRARFRSAYWTFSRSFSTNGFGQFSFMNPTRSDVPSPRCQGG